MGSPGSRKPINLGNWVRNWGSGVAAGASEFEAGVDANTTQHQRAIEAEDQYAAGVQRAVSNKSRVAGLQQKSSQDHWKRNTRAAAGRWAGSGNRKEALEKVAKAASNLAPEMDRIRSEADAKYPNDGIARSQYFLQEMKKSAEIRKSA